MSEKNDQYIRIELNRRQLALALALLTVFAASWMLNADNVTVTTSYPSPTGIYKNLTTTQDTTLARDSGNVTLAPGGGNVLFPAISKLGIGTNSPGTDVDLSRTGASATIRAQTAGGSANKPYNATLELLNNGNKDYKIFADWATNSLILGSYSAGAAGNMMALNGGNGYVGIGTTNPPGPLSVQSANPQLYLNNASGQSKGYLATNGAFGGDVFGNTAGTDDLRIRSDANNMIFGFSGFPYMQLTKSGLYTQQGVWHHGHAGNLPAFFVMVAFDDCTDITYNGTLGNANCPKGYTSLANWHVGNAGQPGGCVNQYAGTSQTWTDDAGTTHGPMSLQSGWLMLCAANSNQ